ncbi:MAG: DNA-3-methyladenine glycosylase family protein [Myxococcota bacterium]
MSFDIHSKSPHDFFLTLDVDEYFEKEYDAEEIFRGGFARPLTLTDRDVLAVIRWNENPEEPVFHVDFPDHTLSAEEEEEARRAVSRTLGAELDTRAFYEAVEDDPTLGPLVEKHYGFKRLSRANFFQDAMRSIIRTRISHGPTQKRMVQDVRKTWGQAFEWRDRTYYSYPRPSILAKAEPQELREYGISNRKGEYVIGMAKEIIAGELDVDALEQMSPEDFYERVQEIRGIGPSTAQSLLLRRNRTDAIFPSEKTKGKEKGIRRWILMSYGLDPHDTPEDEWQQLHDRWRGYETLVSAYFFYNWVMEQKEAEYEGE